jgi:hypothetical protein
MAQTTTLDCARLFVISFRFSFSFVQAFAWMHSAMTHCA